MSEEELRRAEAEAAVQAQAEAAVAAARAQEEAAEAARRAEAEAAAAGGGREPPERARGGGGAGPSRRRATARRRRCANARRPTHLAPLPVGRPALGGARVVDANSPASRAWAHGFELVSNFPRFVASADNAATTIAAAGLALQVTFMVKERARRSSVGWASGQGMMDGSQYDLKHSLDHTSTYVARLDLERLSTSSHACPARAGAAVTPLRRRRCSPRHESAPRAHTHCAHHAAAGDGEVLARVGAAIDDSYSFVWSFCASIPRTARSNASRFPNPLSMTPSRRSRSSARKHKAPRREPVESVADVAGVVEDANQLSGRRPTRGPKT